MEERSYKCPETENLKLFEQRGGIPPRARSKVQKVFHNSLKSQDSSAIQRAQSTGQLNSSAETYTCKRASLTYEVMSQVNSLPVSAKNIGGNGAGVEEGEMNIDLNDTNFKSKIPNPVASLPNEIFSKYNVRSKRIFKFGATTPVHEVSKRGVKSTTFPKELGKNAKAQENRVSDSPCFSACDKVQVVSCTSPTSFSTSTEAALLPEKSIAGENSGEEQCDNQGPTSEKSRFDDKPFESTSTSFAQAENHGSFQENKIALEHETELLNVSEYAIKSTDDNKTDPVSPSVLHSEMLKTYQVSAVNTSHDKTVAESPASPLSVFADMALSSTVADETNVSGNSSPPNLSILESNSVKSNHSSSDSSSSNMQANECLTDMSSESCNTSLINQKKETTNPCSLGNSIKERFEKAASPVKSPILQVQNSVGIDSMHDSQLVTIYTEIAVLFETQFSTKEWIPLHSGISKLVFNKVDESVSIILQKQGKICLNYHLTGTLKFLPLKGCELVYIWRVSDLDPGNDRFHFYALKFESNEAKVNFKRNIDKIQSMMINDKISLNDLELNGFSDCKLQSADDKFVPVVQPLKKNTEHAIDGLDHECDLFNDHTGVKSKVSDSSSHSTNSAIKADLTSISCSKNSAGNKESEKAADLTAFGLDTNSVFEDSNCFPSTATSSSVSFNWSSPINQLSNRSQVSNFVFLPCNQKPGGSVQERGCGLSEIGIQTECPPSFLQTCPPVKDVSRLKEVFGLGLAAANTKSVFSFNLPPLSRNKELPTSDKTTTELNDDVPPLPKSAAFNFRPAAVNTESAQNLQKPTEKTAIDLYEQTNSETATIKKSDDIGNGILQTKAKASTGLFANCVVSNTFVSSNTSSFTFSQVSNFGKKKVVPFFSNPFSTASTSTDTQSLVSSTLTQVVSSVSNPETTEADGSSIRNTDVLQKTDDVSSSSAPMLITSVGTKAGESSSTSDVASKNLLLQTQPLSATLDIVDTKPCASNQLQKLSQPASSNQTSFLNNSSIAALTSDDQTRGIEQQSIFSFSKIKNDFNSKSVCLFGNKQQCNQAIFGSASKSMEGGNSYSNFKLLDPSKSVRESISNLNLNDTSKSNEDSSCNSKATGLAKPAEGGDNANYVKFTGVNFSLGSRVEVPKQNKPARKNSSKKGKMQLLRCNNPPPSEEWEASLLSSLECPVCLEPSTPPIFTCVKGHHICSKCRPRIKHCAICKAHISTARNWVAEDISMKIVKVVCKNSDRGCSARVYLRDLLHHHQNCPLSVSCTCEVTDGGVPIPCLWRGPLADLDRHVEEKHAVHLQGPEYCERIVRHDASNSVIIKDMGYLFHCSLVYSHVNHGWYAFSRLLGRPEDATKFACEFSFFTKAEADLSVKKNPFNLVYCSRVLSFLEDYRKVPILVINGNLFEDLMQDGKLLFYAVKIVNQ